MAERPRYAVCRCDCGAEAEVFASTLKNGASPSCGCVSRVAFAARWTTHGHAAHGVRRSREYETWARIVSKCENPKATGYAIYGGRGITMCRRWRESFAAFFEDMGPRPGPGYSIERLDVNGNYEPGNCVWATMTQQARNRRNNRIVEAFGEAHCVAEWADRTGLSQRTIIQRLNYGIDPEEALTKPVRQRVAFH